ncbi:MAG: sigma-70 family RNA polymerase sigma factor [Anaerolineaceae bacterium]|jgi:RNA polymerase sigma-70 factor (ECF subfamily)
MDEQILIRDAIQGDLDAFNGLVFAYQEMAFNIAYRLLSDEDSAEDATQTAFISAYKNLRGFRGGSFKAWLMRIVTNACYDELRRVKRHPTTSLEPVSDETEEEIDSPAWLADDAASPEERVEQAELEHAVQHCLEKLPEDFKVVVVLVDVQGFDYDEVSKVTKRPLGTIKSRLARARLRLQDCLQQFWELLPDRFRLDDEVSK